MTTTEDKSATSPVEVLIVAVPETAGSALYGMLDVLKAAGNIWQTLVHSDSTHSLFNVRIVSPDRQAFTCGNGIPVNPDCSIADDTATDIVILPELWLGPDEDLNGRYPALMEWLRHMYKQGNIPERTLKRRFKAATGTTLIEYIQNLRIEEAKMLLETSQMPVDDISIAVSYEDASFFRRLFKRLTGLTPSQYRRLFKPVLRLNE